jgi:hypothetical protein
MGYGKLLVLPNHEKPMNLIDAKCDVETVSGNEVVG